MCKNKKCLEKPEAQDLHIAELKPLEVEVLRHIFESVLKSKKVPSIREMAVSLKKSDKELIHVLEILETKDLLFRKEGTQEIISIYPFSLEPTPHKIFLEDVRRLYAMCAVDALGIPVMFNRDVKIVSQCERCRKEIVIEIKNGEIVSKSHPDIMIWQTSRQESRPSAITCCPKINFFCSKEHIEEWKAENLDLVKAGHSLQLEQDFPDIKKRWGAYGQSIGIR